MCVHTDTISSPWEPPIVLSGLDPSIVSLSTLTHSYPLPPPWSQNLILKKDYRKTTWAISCRPENYPPVEKTQLSSLLPPTSPLYLYVSVACQQRFGGDNNSSGGWRGEFSGEVQVYFFLSASLIPSVVCQQRFGGQQQQQWVISKGGGTEVWLPSEPLSAKKEEGKKRRVRMKGRGEEMVLQTEGRYERWREVKDCRQRRLWIKINLLSSCIFTLERSLKFCLK